MKRIYAREEYCIGCRLCEINCAAAHSAYPDSIIKAYKKSKVRPLPLMHVEEDGFLSFALQCRHCDEPECLKSCISGAIVKDPLSGAVILEREKCVGCWTCILACPHGAIERDPLTFKAASKCDLCLTAGGEPVCVQACPNGALSYQEDVPLLLKGES